MLLVPLEPIQERRNQLARRSNVTGLARRLRHAHGASRIEVVGSPTPQLCAKPIKVRVPILPGILQVGYNAVVQAGRFVARRSCFTELPYHEVIADLLDPWFEARARLPNSVQPGQVLVDNPDFAGARCRRDRNAIPKRLILSREHGRPQIGLEIERDLLLFKQVAEPSTREAKCLEWITPDRRCKSIAHGALGHQPAEQHQCLE
ncbi:MAG: hypothetical protein E6J90_41955 [Deltaproteobacteria bacterium]|nr:MAG: hypothetical protein E6J90_41955 [Deltaproteobacteria bacterium]